MAYPSAQAEGMPNTASMPLIESVVASRRRSSLIRRTPSRSPSSAACIRAIARAEVLPPAGMSARHARPQRRPGGRLRPGLFLKISFHFILLAAEQQFSASLDERTRPDSSLED